MVFVLRLYLLTLYSLIINFDLNRSSEMDDVFSLD